jgi:hypothetical protein
MPTIRFNLFLYSNFVSFVPLFFRKILWLILWVGPKRKKDPQV